MSCRRELSGVILVLIIAFVMLAIILIAALVVVYVAYPHRGEPVPRAPWLGQVLRKGVDAIPTLDETDGDRVGADRR